jgi:hypothetical protein
MLLTIAFHNFAYDSLFNFLTTFYLFRKSDERKKILEIRRRRRREEAVRGCCVLKK